MKKYSLYLASLAFAAFLAILAACGSGEVVELTDPKNGMKNLFEAIEWCLEGKEVAYFDCEALLTEYGQSSSSEDGGDDSSPSYSSPGEDPDDSSSSAAPSSSSYYNPDAYEIPDFTCSWDPSSQKLGGDTKIKIAFVDGEPEDADCTYKKGFIKTKNAAWGNDGEADTVFFESGSNITVTGNITSKLGEAWSWPTESKAGGDTTLLITGLVICTPDNPANVNRGEKECPLTIVPTTKPISSGKMSCDWLYLSDGKSVSINATLNACTKGSINISNSTEANCDEMYYTTNGVTTAVAGNIVKGYIAVKCGDLQNVEYKLDSTEATVVPNPSLTGSCKWSKTSPALQPVTLSGVTLENDYGRCTSKDVAYKQNGTTLTNGSIAKGTYNNVIPTLECGGTYGTLTAAKCPNMTVQDVISCTLPTGTYAIGDNVPAPTLVCASDPEAGGTIRNDSRTYEGNVPEDNNQWGNAGNGVYKTAGAKNITLKKAICGNTTHDNLGTVCTGTLNIKSLDDLGGASCSFAKSSYGMGERFKPTLTCPTGYSLVTNGITYTGGPDGNNSQWGGNSDGQYKTAGDKTPVATFKCQKNNVQTELTKSCGTITITNPTTTCTMEAGPFSVGQSIKVPTLSCGSTDYSVDNKSFTVTEGGLGGQWNNNGNGWFTTAGSKTVTAGFRCNRNNDSYQATNIACGTLNIKSLEETEGVSCSFEKSSYGMGEKFKPTLTCPTGYSLVTNGITYTGGPDGNNSQWSNNGDGQYKTAGDKTPVATFKCKTGEVEASVTKSCGTITITKPTCELPASNSYGIDQDVPAPTVYCYGTTKASNNDREYTGASGSAMPDKSNNWNNNAGNGQYTASGAKGPITLKKANCNNDTFDNLNVLCTGLGGVTTFTIKP